MTVGAGRAKWRHRAAASEQRPDLVEVGLRHAGRSEGFQVSILGRENAGGQVVFFQFLPCFKQNFTSKEIC